MKEHDFERVLLLQQGRRATDVAGRTSLRTWWHRFHGRLAQCPDTEVEQNKIRLILCAVTAGWGVACHLLWSMDIGLYLVGPIVYSIYALFNFAWIYRDPRPRRSRRLLTTFGDRATLSWMASFPGEWTTFIYPFFVWTDIGNTARYGKSYLLPSMLFSAVGFSCVIAINPFWQAHPIAAGSLLFGIIMQPAFTNLFLRRKDREKDRYAELATHDTLTGLANRAFLYARLNETIALAQRHNRSFSVLFIDIDNFKNVNDTIGHDAGDAFLQRAAQVLRDTVRQSDTVARLGGDEFIVVLYETSDATAHTSGQNLTANLQEAGISASIGIANFPKCGNDAETLVRHSDQAMYAAKRLGKRNCQLCGLKHLH